MPDSIAQADQAAAHRLIFSLSCKSSLISNSSSIARHSCLLRASLLFHVSVDEQVLDFGYPGPFFGHEMFILLHYQSPSKLFWQSAISS
jgi:hypothetical protein